jgi:peptidoglycan/xylan/chitin deacetylase (PgdA/CDA1 family)
MSLPGVKTLKKFSRWVQARVLGGALILGYHRISRPQDDVYDVCVSPENFAAQMEAVQKYAHPISLYKLVQCLKNDALPPKSVAVTFDDGYADNLYQAKTILEKYAIPATVFICTGYVGKEFWWDELDRLVRFSRAELDALRLEARGNRFVWDRPKVSPAADVHVRRKFHRALYYFLLALDIEEQNHAMNTIRSWSGVAYSEMTARAMTHDELLRIADDGMIELGAHTRHHLVLPQLSLERQREEIMLGKTDLEGLLGRRVEGFAYPNGITTESVTRIVRESAFSHACMSESDVIRDNHNIYQIPRFWPQDWDGEKFTRWLKRWLQ